MDFVRGQAPAFAIPRQQCAKVSFPVVVDDKRERITPIGEAGLLELMQTLPCAKTSFELYRTRAGRGKGQRPSAK